MSSGLKGYLSSKLGKYVLAQERDGTIRQIKEFMSDLVAPEFTLVSLAKGLLYRPHPGGPKDGRSPFAERGHWGGDNRVLGPSINHKSHFLAPTFSLTMGSWGPRRKEPSPPQSESIPARPMRSSSWGSSL